MRACVLHGPKFEQGLRLLGTTNFLLVLQRWRRNEFSLSEEGIRHLMCYRSARASSSHGLAMRIQEYEKVLRISLFAIRKK